MTHHPLTKAEREELRRLDDQDRSVWSHDRGSVESTDPRALPGETSGFRYYMGSGAPLAAAARNALPRLLADLDAAEAERDALRQIAEGCCNATDGGCSPGVSIEFLRDVPSEVEHIKRERDRLRKMPQSAFEAATFRELNAMEAQRDRAESELDAERRMRVEAEAASDRAESERATAESIAAQATARMEEMRGERDALARQYDALHGHHQGMHEELQSILGSDDSVLELARKAADQRDALKAKLDDPRRVLIHETEVVATKEEIATLKAKLDHAEEQNDELFNIGAALKAKLAALVDSCRSAETILGNMAKETGRTFGRWEIHHEPLRNDAQRMLQSFRAAIAAASGGVS